MSGMASFAGVVQSSQPEPRKKTQRGPGMHWPSRRIFLALFGRSRNVQTVPSPPRGHTTQGECHRAGIRQVYKVQCITCEQFTGL